MIELSKELGENELLDKVDALILSVSFENRCLSIINHLPIEQVENVYAFVLSQDIGYKTDNLDMLENKYSPNYKLFKCNHDDPISIVDKFIDVFVSLNTAKTILIDISAFTRESLLILLKLVYIQKSSFERIYFFYSTANMNTLLSYGVKEIRSVIGYIGDIQVDKPLHLVLLLGFELERALRIIDEMEPSSLSIGVVSCLESISDDMQKYSSKMINELKQFYEDLNITTFDYSLKDIEKTKNAILRETNKHKSKNIVLVPLNNKLSTIAAGIVAIENEDIQICYAQMSNYNASCYSEVRDNCYLFELVDD